MLDNGKPLGSLLSTETVFI